MKWSTAARDKAIALAQQGFTDKVIAQHLGVSQQTFSGWRMRKPLFRAEMDAAKLPTKAARRLLNGKISPNSEQGRRLIAMAWQVHRAQPPAPEPPAPPTSAKRGPAG